MLPLPPQDGTVLRGSGSVLFICSLRGGTVGISLPLGQLKGILPSRCRARRCSPVRASQECAGVCMPADVCTICVMVYARVSVRPCVWT